METQVKSANRNLYIISSNISWTNLIHLRITLCNALILLVNVYFPCACIQYLVVCNL